MSNVEQMLAGIKRQARALLSSARNLDGIREPRDPRFKLKDVILNLPLCYQMADIVQQQRCRDLLRAYRKVPTRHLLFVGPSGSGKTRAAEALAGELDLPLYVIRVGALISNHTGCISGKLRLVFDEAAKRRGVYLFEEFDEAWPWRNSFLQFMEEENSTDSLIIYSTTGRALFGRELLRRYDQVLEFDLPTEGLLRSILVGNLESMCFESLDWALITPAALNLFQSDLVSAAENAVKTAIMAGRNKILTNDLLDRIKEQHAKFGSLSSKKTS